MLHCKEIVRILSSEEKLSWMKKTELKMHLLMCHHCLTYATHLKSMQHGFIKLFSKMTSIKDNKVTDLENEILAKLRNKGNNGM